MLEASLADASEKRCHPESALMAGEGAPYVPGTITTSSVRLRLDPSTTQHSHRGVDRSAQNDIVQCACKGSGNFGTPQHRVALANLVRMCLIVP